MKRTTKALSAAALALALLGAASDARATGLAVDEATLSAKVDTQLRAQIAKAHSADPTAFQAVRSLALRAPSLDRAARGRKAPIARHLANLGPRALMPMLELLVVDAHDVPSSVRLDLIAAVGRLRDARALPVLSTLLGQAGDFDTARTAAEAIARLDDDAAAARLVSALGNASGDRKNAILAGMGACHREAVARALADVVTAHANEETARHAIRSLGRTGNAAAWKTLADRSQEAATRSAAAKALVEAFVDYEGDVRQAASNALMVVDAPETPALVREARANASRETAAALDELAARFARNPTRTR